MAQYLDGYADYHEWAFNRAGIRSEGIIVADLPAPYGRGWIATTHIRAGTRILTVPAAATLSMNDLRAHPVKPLVDALIAAKIVLNEDDILALMLLFEKSVRARESKYFMHISALPATIDVPYMYTDDEVETFKGTNLYPLASAMVKQAKADHEAIMAVLTRPGAAFALPASAFTLEAYRWALAIVCSRCVSLRYGRDTKPAKTLTPFFDMANHSSDAHVRHFYDPGSKSVVVVTDQAFAPGDQVFLNYGDTSIVNMMRLYGFATPNNPMQEMYVLQANMTEKIPYFQERVAMMNRYAGFMSSTPAEIMAATRAAQGATTAAAASATAEGAAADGSAVEAVVSSPSDPRCMQGVMYETQGGIALDFGLSYGAAHLGVLRVLRILRAESLEELDALAEEMRRNPDQATSGIESEATMLQQLADTLHAQLEGLTAMADEDALEEEFQASYAPGADVMKAVADSIRTELIARSRLTRAELAAAIADVEAQARAAEAAQQDDDDDEESFATSILAGGKASGGRKKAGAAHRKGGKGKKGGKGGSAAAAEAAPGTAGSDTAGSAVELSSAAKAAAAAAPAPVDSHHYRRMLAAHLRHVERRILTFHLHVTVRDLQELESIAKAWNETHGAAAAAEGAAAAAEGAAAGEAAVEQVTADVAKAAV